MLLYLFIYLYIDSLLLFYLWFLFYTLFFPFIFLFFVFEVISFFHIVLFNRILHFNLYFFLQNLAFYPFSSFFQCIPTYIYSATVLFFIFIPHLWFHSITLLSCLLFPDEWFYTPTYIISAFFVIICLFFLDFFPFSCLAVIKFLWQYDKKNDRFFRVIDAINKKFLKHTLILECKEFYFGSYQIHYYRNNYFFVVVFLSSHP